MTQATMRQRLAGDTSRAHRALHSDPLLQRLTAPDVSLSDYKMALEAFFAFHSIVERERHRLDCWPQFALTDWLCALETDLQGALPTGPRTLGLTSQVDGLGALYVAHGSFLGRSVLKGHVVAAFPDLPHAYLSHGFPSDTWRSLCRALDRAGTKPSGYNALRFGARRSFELMACLLGDDAFSA